MLKSELLQLVANGESSYVEFKLDEVRPEQLAKEVVALINHQGGRVLVGVDDDGQIVGITRPDLERWIMDTVFARFIHPWILPSYEEVDIDGDRRVAVITVAQGVAKPYVVRHSDREDTYVRLGSTSRRATREQQARLFAAGAMVHTEAQPVSGSSFSDLSQPRLENYLRDVLLDAVLPRDVSEWVDRLAGLGLMTRVEGMAPACSIAGVVLFALGSRRLLRQAGIRFMAFDGLDKDYQALDDTVLDAPLVALWAGRPGASEQIEPGLFERFIERSAAHLSSESTTLSGGVRRDRAWAYPVDAVRESVVNALAHRDWTRSTEVEVARYGDRLEVTSPGALQNSMTVDKMLAGQRSARNQTIVDVLRDYGYVDARGMGVRRKIVPLVHAASGVDPTFDATDDYVRVIMPRGT